MLDFIKAFFVSILHFFYPPAPAEVAVVEEVARPVEPAPIQELLFDEEQSNCAALNIYFEARNQNPEGQVAVSHVVFNRAKDDFWPDNICDVVKQGSYTTNYHAVDIDPAWRKDRGMTYVKTIDDHHFYCWKRLTVASN
jgi:hypothetical protein